MKNIVLLDFRKLQVAGFLELDAKILLRSENYIFMVLWCGFNCQRIGITVGDDFGLIGYVFHS